MRGKWEGEIKRENEKETERGLHFVYLLYTKCLLNLAPLTPPWRGRTCKDNFNYFITKKPHKAVINIVKPNLALKVFHLPTQEGAREGRP